MNPLDTVNVDKIFAISVISAYDRREQLTQCLPNADIEFILVEKKTNPTKGCFMSHRHAIELGKQRGYKTILILEDDAYPLVNWETLVNNTNNSLNTIPKGWKYLSLGYLPIRLKETQNSGLLEIKCAFDAHAYIVNLDNVSLIEWSDNKTLDGELFCGGITQYTLLSSMGNIISNGTGVLDTYAIYPMLFKQKTNKSYINDVDLLQEHFFNFFGGHSNSAYIAKNINTLLFCTLCILSLLYVITKSKYIIYSFYIIIPILLYDYVCGTL